VAVAAADIEAGAQQSALEQQPEGPCSVDCEVKGTHMNCQDRVLLSADRSIDHAGDDVCDVAYATTIGQCPQCAACPLSATLCGTLPPYDCKDDSSPWHTDKQAWCCQQDNISCDEVQANLARQAAEPQQQQDGYDCNTEPWSLDKWHWCCVHSDNCFDKSQAAAAGLAVAIGDHVSNAADAAGDLAGDVHGAVMHHVGQALDTPIGDHVANAADAVQDVAGDVHGAVAHHVGQAMNTDVGEHIGNAADAIGDAAGEAHAAASHHLGNAADAIGDAAGDAHAAASHHLGNAAGWLGSQLGWGGQEEQEEKAAGPGQEAASAPEPEETQPP
jgi:hypothetical protein